MDYPKLPNESDKAYQAFLFYAERQSQNISKSTVAKLLNHSTTLIYRWAHRFMWDERIQAANGLAVSVFEENTVTPVSKEEYETLSRLYIAKALPIIFKTLDLRLQVWQNETPDSREVREYVATLDKVDTLARRILGIDTRKKSSDDIDYGDYILGDE